MRTQYFTIPKNLHLAALITGCFCIQLATAQAQTQTENLQKGVEIYNALREYEDGLVASTLTAEEIADVKNRMTKGIVLLDKVIKEGNAEEIRAARYFKNNFRYEYLFVLGMKGQNAAAYEICKEIERDMTGYTAADFPIKYVFFDKNYVINWDNFSSTQAEYLTGYAEIAYNLQKYEDAVRLGRQTLTHPGTSNWLRYIALFKMLDIYDKSNASITEVEQLDFALQSIQAYNKLTESERKTVADNKYPTDARGVNIILDKAIKNVPAALERSGEAALASSQGPLNEKTLQLFELFYRSKQPGDANFNTAAEIYARKTSVLYTAKATSVGISAIDRTALAIAPTDCAGLSNIIEKYTYWKQLTKAEEYRKKQQKCLDNEAKARKKAEKVVRRSNRNFNLYAGAYIIPLIKTNAKRDYGVALNFVFKKTAWEFSYLKIKANKENVFDLTIRDVDAKQDDLPRWNGFYAHVQPKFFSKNGPMYTGILLGYAQKDFGELTANVTHDADGLVTTETFNPKTTQYIAMVNVGGLALARGFGMDLYCGIGGAYSQWDRGNTLNTADYTIDNVALENRKDEHFSLLIRVGLTMGLNFGRGNMK